MSDEQIEKHFNALYEHFEYGSPAPAGVSLKAGLRETIGRAWQADEVTLHQIPA